MLTLALGIGVNTAVFTLLNSVLLQPLGHPNPEQLMHFDRLLSVAKYISFDRSINRFRRLVRTTAGIDAYTTSEVNLTAGDRPLRVRSISVDALLRTLATTRPQGRFFTDEETRFGMGGLARPVAILSHGLWQTAFDGRSGVGHTASIGGRTHEIVGVMPPGFDVMDHRVGVWLPVGSPAAIRDNRASHLLQVIGRLKPGVTPQAAETELTTLIEQWRVRTGASGHVPTNRPTDAADHELACARCRKWLWVKRVGTFGPFRRRSDLSCSWHARILRTFSSRERSLVGASSLSAGGARSESQPTVGQGLTESLLLATAGGAIGLGWHRRRCAR